MTDTDLTRTLAGSLADVRMDAELPRRADLGLVFNELDSQLATQAYLWALPLVSFAQWQAQHRDLFGATSYDLVHYATYQDKLGILTANATTPYTLAFIDLSQTGPVMIEVPPGPTAGGLADFWQREFGILGEMGPDQGRGGRHVIVPPGRQAPAPDGCYAYQSTGMNVMFGFRTLDPDPKRAHGAVPGGADYPGRRPGRPGRPGSSRPWAAGGAPSSRAASTTGPDCTTSTSARSSTSATGSTWRCCASSGSRRAGRSSRESG